MKYAALAWGSFTNETTILVFPMVIEDRGKSYWKPKNLVTRRLGSFILENWEKKYL